MSMSKSDLKVSLVQSNIVWENKDLNLRNLQEQLHDIKAGSTHIILLPEMFATGFSMHTHALAETMTGPTLQWMHKQAQDKKAIIAGSVIIEDKGHVFNRLVWVLPNGSIAHYDKRHLFSYAEEDRHYTQGEKRVIAQVNGWKICLNICYDLRFPVWARNTEHYDVYINVANWPQQRNEAWETLLKARAIENMCYTIGVNRVGEDAKGNSYVGNSSIYDPLGKLLIRATPSTAATLHYSLSYNYLAEQRARFPFLEDGDDFLLK